MNRVEISDRTSFCQTTQSFVFTDIETARAFMDKFGTVFGLEPFITEQENGEFHVAIETLLGVMYGE